MRSKEFLLHQLMLGKKGRINRIARRSVTRDAVATRWRLTMGATRYLLCLVCLATALLPGVFILSTPPQTVSVPVKAVYMDYSSRHVRAVSPNGKFEVTVSGEKTSLGAWVTVNEPTQGWALRVWPIERNVKVLWRPDSRAFALTDDRYANQSFVLIVGTKFRMRGPDLGVQRVDITPILRAAFAGRARRYYRKHYHISDYDGSYSFYAVALRWVSNDRLLVGVSTITSLPKHGLGNAAGVKGWKLGYLLDLPHKRILRTLTNKSLRAEYGINLSERALRN